MLFRICLPPFDAFVQNRAYKLDFCWIRRILSLAYSLLFNLLYASYLFPSCALGNEYSFSDYFRKCLGK